MQRWWMYGLALALIAGCTGGTPKGTATAEPPYPIQAEFPGQAAALDGDWLIVGSGGGLTAHNLVTGKAVPVPGARAGGGFAAGGGKLVWSNGSDIMLMDLAGGQAAPITHEPGTKQHPDTDGKTVVWEDYRNDYRTPDIYAYDIATGKEQRITAGPAEHFRPRVDAGIIVWMDGRNNPRQDGARGCANCPENNWDIYGYDLAAGREFPVATAKVMETTPAISGQRVAWVELHNKQSDQIWVLDLQSGQRRQLTQGSVIRHDVRIDGDRVVWTDERRGHATNDVNIDQANADIFLYNLSSGTETRLTGDWIQAMPAISGRRVAFLYDRQVDPRIQLIEAP